MNQKEISELRRRWGYEKNAVSRIYGCFVNGSKEIVSNLDESLGAMSQEEAEKYLGLLKKALSGRLGKNLIDIAFSTKQVMEGDEHRLLCALRQSALKDGEARNTFYQNVVNSLDMGDSSYPTTFPAAGGMTRLSPTLQRRYFPIFSAASAR